MLRRTPPIGKYSNWLANRLLTIHIYVTHGLYSTVGKWEEEEGGRGGIWMIAVVQLNSFVPLSMVGLGANELFSLFEGMGPPGQAKMPII